MESVNEKTKGLYKSLIDTITKLLTGISLLLVVLVLAFLLLIKTDKSFFTINWQTTQIADTETTTAAASVVPTEKNYFENVRNPHTELADKTDMESEFIKYGYDLIAETYKYIGPENGDPKMVYTGNNLACKNCHLDAGQRAYSAPYVGVVGRFPNFRSRENTVGTIQDRINGCMERSMNGKRLPDASKEMRSMVAYMTWLSTGVPTKEKIKGSGFVKVKFPNRAVDLASGEQIYTEKCASCHQANGQGMKLADSPGYMYPPLWGKDSYNHGAGMNRVLTAAQFLKANMPFGATAENPLLTDDEAYDVAGYIDSQDRPLKSNPEKDFPNKLLKPVSTPYGPWEDSFTAEQHKFGPFQPIMEYYEKEHGIKKSK